MKKLLCFSFVLLLVVCLYAGPGLYAKWQWTKDDRFGALIVYTGRGLEGAGFIADAYESVMQEEGVSYERIAAQDLVELNAINVAERIPALLFPEHLVQVAPSGLSAWLAEYLAAGGSVLAVYDVGVQNERGILREKAELSDLIGVNYIQAAQNNKKQFETAWVEFTSPEKRDFFAITPGRTVRELTISDVYKEEARFSVAIAQPAADFDEKTVYAWAMTEQNKKYPALIVAEQKKGRILYANLPLGLLKAGGDDMLLRVVLRTFLFEIAKMPHFMNVEDGLGVFILNWQSYIRMEEENLADKIDGGYFREDLRTSIHIAAGDYLKTPGDGQGFDAAGYGLWAGKELMKYGRIGSLGGWAHHWFITRLEQNRFTKQEIKENIQNNNNVLKGLTGYDIREFSAPGGLHPQPMMTRVLEELGMNSYSYRGDWGSAPNRAFTGRKKTSDTVIAFPLTPYNRYPTLWDYYQIFSPTPDNEAFGLWLRALADYVAAQKTVRTLQIPEHEIAYFPGAIAGFIEYLALRQNEQKSLIVMPMSEYADFFLRFLKTEYSFHKQGKRLSVALKNPEYLGGIVLALPKDKYERPADSSLEVTEDDKCYYVKTAEPTEKTKNIVVSVID